MLVVCRVQLISKDWISIYSNQFVAIARSNIISNEWHFFSRIIQNWEILSLKCLRQNLPQSNTKEMIQHSKSKMHFHSFMNRIESSIPIKICHCAILHTHTHTKNAIITWLSFSVLSFWIYIQFEQIRNVPFVFNATKIDFAVLFLRFCIILRTFVGAQLVDMQLWRIDDI